MTSVVQSLEVSYFVQLTEDEERVRRAVAALLGGEPAGERQEAEGHFGNRILWIKVHLTGEEAEVGLGRIASSLGPDERRAILEDLQGSLDEHNALYIRLNKQVLVMSGSAVLASSDPIRVKVKLRTHAVKRDPAGFYARLFEGAPG